MSLHFFSFQVYPKGGFSNARALRDKKKPAFKISGLDNNTLSNPLIARFLAQAGTFLPSRIRD
jgi:hypothetical protein